jgi:uncharacterized damage-inducible protein DinB
MRDVNFSSPAVQRNGEHAKLESEQRRFIAALHVEDLGRLIELKDGEGRTHRCPLGLLLLHMPNHATHHRSEIATMLTMLSGSPPGTGILDYRAQKSGSRHA